MGVNYKLEGGFFTAKSIQGSKLFKGGNYSRNYGN